MAAGGMQSMLAYPGGSAGGMQTVPGGSQSANPIGGSVFSTLQSTSPTVATLPGAPGGTGVNPGLNINLPGGLQGPGTPAAGGGYNPATGAGANAPTTAGGSHTLLGDIQQTYGRGTGTAIATELGGLGTSTSEALGIMNQSAIDAAQRQYGNIQAQQAAAGVDPGSSAAALMSADFSSQLTGELASTAAQLGLSEEQMKLSGLMGEGQAHGGDTSFMKSLSGVLGSGIVQAGAGAISQGFGIGGKGGSILDAIAGL